MDKTKIVGQGLTTITIRCLENHVSELETKIKSIADSKLYRWLGIGQEDLISHISDLRKVINTSNPLGLEEKALLFKITGIYIRVIKPKVLDKTYSTRTKTTVSGLTEQLKPFLVNADKKSFIDYNSNSFHPFPFELNGKKFDVRGAGIGSDGHVIASGAFGRVFFGTHPDTPPQREIAVKIVKRNPNQDWKDLQREADFLLKMNGSEHVLGASEVGFHGDYMFVVMDKVDGKELFDKLRDKKSPMTDTQKIQVALDVAKGLKELHAKGIIHRDIKPENILVDNQGRAKLIDLGLARTIEEKSKRYSGTIPYMAPEVLKQEEQGAATDVYSMGLIIHELFTGMVPYSPIYVDARGNEKMNETRLQANITAKSDNYKNNRSGISEGLPGIVNGCLKLHPQNRITVDALIAELEKLLSSIKE